MMRTALEYAKTFGIPVADHCEDMSLATGGSMHEGIVSTRLGLKGIPAAAEEVMVARDILLAELTGGHVHLCHMSTRGSVELIRRAKERGIRVTAEACAFYPSTMLRTVPLPISDGEDKAQPFKAATARRSTERGRIRPACEVILFISPGTTIGLFRASPASPAATTAFGSVAIFASRPLGLPATSKNSVAVGPGQSAVTWTPLRFDCSCRASLSDRT
jgi:hypothetical protein